VRRGIAEAMLGRGVIVIEGLTEHLGLAAVAEKLEQADQNLYSLDLSGATFFCADGDGSVAEFGKFFVSLDMPTFAFLDKKTRPKAEAEQLKIAGFQILRETAYDGMEALLATEIPLGRQWSYLERLRDGELTPKTKIPAARPADNVIRDLTRQVLKDGKGWGRAAELIETCIAIEMPPTITGFLAEIYKKFPRPVAPALAVDATAEDVPAEEQNQTPPADSLVEANC
jgi:putative ATP-dependent endonuclease of OLD family